VVQWLFESMVLSWTTYAGTGFYSSDCDFVQWKGFDMLPNATKAGKNVSQTFM